MQQFLVFTGIVFASAVLARPDYRNLVFEAMPMPEAELLQPASPAIVNFLRFEEYKPTIYTGSGMTDVDLTAAISERLDNIENTINNEGHYSKVMAKDLTALARLYQDNGEHEMALNTFDRAIQVSKIHNGLFHEDQVPLIESSIQSLLSLGRYADVEEQLDFLIYLHEKHYGANSIELIGPLASKVAWDMYMFEQNALLGKQFAEPGAMINGFASVPGGQIASPGILVQTQEKIIKGIQILVNANDFANPFLHQFEQQLIETYFYQAYHDGQTRASQHYVASLDGSYISSGPFNYTLANYQNGEKAYQRLLAYLDKSGQGNSMEYVLTTLGLGDWYMLFNKLGKGREQYHKAGLILENGNFSDVDKRSLLQPAIPVELPAFGEIPLVSAVKNDMWKDEALSDYKGFVDISLALSKQGRVTELEVLGQSPDTPKYIVSELEWKLRDSHYRPVISEAEPVSSQPLQVRYYYNY